MSIDVLNRWTYAVIRTIAAETLREADLSGADLRKADLRGADLSGADLREADLSGADLSGAYLSEADLSGADLSGADLRGAYLSGAYLRGADLSGADLSGAYLRKADLSGAYLREADLRKAYLSEADLSGADGLTATADVLRIVGSRGPIWCIDADNVSVGCIRNTMAWWLEHHAETGAENGYTPAEIEEYRLHLEYCEHWLRARDARRAK